MKTRSSSRKTDGGIMKQSRGRLLDLRGRDEGRLGGVDRALVGGMYTHGSVLIIMLVPRFAGHFPPTHR
jgi:hypothetical protein